MAARSDRFRQFAEQVRIWRAASLACGTEAGLGLAGLFSWLVATLADRDATDVPSTNGKVETHFISFAEAGWKSLFGAPVLSYADTLKEGMGLIFVGDTENTIAFSGLRIDGWTPLCQ